MKNLNALSSSKTKIRSLLIGLALPCLILALLVAARSSSASSEDTISDNHALFVPATNPSVPPTKREVRATRAFRVDSQTTTAGQMVTVPIRVDTMGDEAGYSFSLSYNATVLMNPVVTIGTAGGDVVSNTMPAGQIGFSVTSFSGGTIAEGTDLLLVTVRFTVAANAPAGTVTPVNFTDTPARRKASGTDPNVMIVQPTYTNGTVTINPNQQGSPRAFRLDSRISSATQMVTVPVRVDATGDEAGYSFSLSYDPAILTNAVVTIGTAGGDVVSNVTTMPPGRIGFSVTSFAGGTIMSGNNQLLVTVRFTVAPDAPSGTVTPINFTDDPARRKASATDPNMMLVQPTYTNGTVTITAAPTAGSVIVQGRAVTAQGRGIARALITLTSNTGDSVTVLTNPRGYFNFAGVQAGETYIVTASSKRYRFSPSSQLINVTDNLLGVEFVGR